MAIIRQPARFLLAPLGQTEKSLTEPQVDNEQNQEEDLHVIDDLVQHVDEVPRLLEDAQEIKELDPNGQAADTVHGDHKFRLLVLPIGPLG